MAVDLGSTFKELIDEINSKSDGNIVDSELSNTSTNAVQNKVVKAALDGKQASGNYVKYTAHSGVTAGKKTNVTTYSYQQSPMVVSNGMIIGGTAQEAGLITRGISGATTPDTSTGACTTDNLYVNYDGDSKYSRYMILGAGDTGADITTNTEKTTHAAKQYGTLMSAIRGDQMVNYVTDKLANVPTADEISEIKAAVAGKAKSYVLSYNDSFTNGREGATWYDKDGNDITSSIGTGNYTTCNNDMFNLVSTDPLDPHIQGGQIIVRIFNEIASVTSGYNYLVLSIDTGGGLNIGDNIYVVETDVPDRWYAGNQRFYALESKLIGYASLSGNNTFTGNNKFKDKIQVVDPNYVPTTFGYNGITTGEYNLTFPSKSGTIALTSDIPSTTNLVTLDTAQTISGAKTFTGDTTVHGGTFKVSKTDSANKTTSAVYGANAITYTPYGSTSQKLISLPSSDGTIALTSDIPSTSSFVTTNADQTISGIKTFTSGSIVVSKTDFSNKTMKVSYGCNGIAYTPYGTNSIHIISFPAKDGTFALTSDIPNLTNYVTIDTAQTITGVKTFNAPTDVSGKETTTTKFKTSNGGSITIGKEGQNSGTMLRFDQVDGTCRLRFRSSATPGAIVWSQPEKNAVLYFDMGNSAGSGVNRVTLRNVAGTLALTKELPAAVSANPTLSGSETELAGLQIGSTKYKIVTQTYVDNAIGNIDTLLTALNSGTGV